MATPRPKSQPATGRAAERRYRTPAEADPDDTTTDITSRRAAEDALRASEEKFASAFALSPLAISLTALPSGQFIDVNEALIRLTGYSRQELIGHTPIELGLWADESAWRQGRDILVREGRLPQNEARFRRKDGGIIVGLAAAERIVVGGQPALLTVIADITERRRVEAALQTGARRAAFRAALGDALRPLSDPAAIQAESARLLAEHLGATRAFYAEVEADSQHLVIGQDYHHGVPSIAGRYRLDDSGAILAEAFRAGRTVVMEDVATQGGLSNEERAAYAAISSAPTPRSASSSTGDSSASSGCARTRRAPGPPTRWRCWRRPPSAPGRRSSAPAPRPHCGPARSAWPWRSPAHARARGNGIWSRSA
ncbi:MAG: PAS domain S-box protein [Thermomicrobiales bacterium]